MTSANRIAEIAEIDTFLAEPKMLVAAMPLWGRHSRDWWRATWPILDAQGIVRQKTSLSFQMDVDRQSVAIRLNFSGRAVFGVDIDPDSVIKNNPPTAIALGLPAKIAGPHWHRWDDNRQHWLNNKDVGDLPNRRPLPNVRRLPQGFFELAAATNITLSHDQRAFDVPPQGSLF